MAVQKIQIDIEKEFTLTENKLKGGQQGKTGYRSVVWQSDNKLWRFKTGMEPGHSVLQEYLGFTAYQALGIPMLNFDIGIIGVDAPDDPGAIVFLQEYLPINHDFPQDSKFADRILSLDIDIVVPLIVAIAILGDTDGVGQNDDNVLLDIDKETNRMKLIKIDCGRVFEKLDNEWLKGNVGGALGTIYPSLISKYVQHTESDIIARINKFLTEINIYKLIQNLRNAYEKFERLIKKDKGAHRTIARKHQESIALLRFKNIDDLCERICRNIESQKVFFSSKRVENNATVTGNSGHQQVSMQSDSSIASSAAVATLSQDSGMPLSIASTSFSQRPVDISKTLSQTGSPIHTIMSEVGSNNAKPQLIVKESELKTGGCSSNNL